MKPAVLVKTGILDYQKAWDLQRALHRKRLAREIPDTLILTQHPHTYTLGKSGHENHLLVDETALKREGVGVFRIDRGGDITYHGPGQIVGYPILDLRNHYLDVHRFLRDLEEVLIRVLADHGLEAGRVPGLTGVWVNGAKVAAIGVKVSRWVTMHGFAFNVDPDLRYFGRIVPCGIPDKPVTSVRQLLGHRVDYGEVEACVAERFSQVFGLDLRPVDQSEFETLTSVAEVG